MFVPARISRHDGERGDDGDEHPPCDARVLPPVDRHAPSMTEAGAPTARFHSVRCLGHNGRMTTPSPVEIAEPDVDEIVELEDPWVTIVWNDPVNLMSYVAY